jgi:hypothetical protein
MIFLFFTIFHQDLSTEIKDGISLSASVDMSGIYDVILVNGQYQPKLNIKPQEWHLFHIVNAVSDVYLELEIRNSATIGI